MGRRVIVAARLDLTELGPLCELLAESPRDATA